jgi:amino acid adenylation domain-containing protein
MAESRAGGSGPGHPLTPAQYDIWLAHQLDPTGTAYTVAETFEVHGPLDVETLVHAFDDVVHRHAALRAHFYDTQSGPRQSIMDSAALPLVVLAEDVAAPPVPRFDLVGGAPVAAYVRAEGPDRHQVTFAAHHIAIDGPSLRVLFRDLGSAYETRHAGRVPDRTPDLGFLEYVAWVDAGPAPDLGYWRRRLRGAGRNLELPHDQPAGVADGDLDAGVCDFAVDPAVADAVRRLARDAGSSVFCVLAAGFAALVGRVAGTDDVPIGVAVSGRRPGPDDETVGCYAGTVVLRAAVPPDLSFARLVDAVTDEIFEAAQRQGASLRELSADVGQVTGKFHPLLRVLLAFNAEPPRLVLAGARCRRLPRVHGAPKAELTLNLEGGDSRTPLTGQLVYDRRLLSARAAQDLAKCYRRLVAALAGTPSTALGVPPLVAPEVPGPTEPTAGEPHLTDAVSAIMDRTRRDGDAVAATDGGRNVLRYADLVRRATGYAAELRALGVRDGSVCAIALPASPDVLVAVLACWLAGAAFLIVDPDLPVQRRRRLIRCSGARLVLLRPGEAADDLGVPAIDEVRAAQVGVGPHSDVAAAATHGGIAYLATTSGSTGEPKLVLVGHPALAAYLRYAVARYAPAAAGVALLHSPLSFDMSMTALLVPLVAGGTVRFGPLTAIDPAPALIKLTPSHLRMIELLDEDPAPAQLLIVAGEALDGDLVRTWRARHPDVPVCNAYGPCEATVTSFQHVIAPGDPLPSGPVPIGRPFGATRGYVLDDRLRPQPAGVSGELFLGGPQLAYGYASDPVLTAQRFLPDPFGPPGARMYRTGDRVRMLATGEFVFVGRTDDQLSIRGHRVEPAEVEQAGRSCPGVTGFAVALDGDAQTLVAFATVGGCGTAPSAIRAHLAARLPTYLVPSTVEVVPQLPTTRHGKVDRAALAALAGSRRSRDARRAVPAEPAAPPGVAAVSALFAEVLGVSGLSAWDNFFELGGHSLLAAQLVGRMRERLGARLSLRDVVTTPTPAGLAAKLAARPADPGLDLVLGIRPGGSTTPLICLPPVVGVGWCYIGLLPLVGERHPVYALQSAAILGGQGEPRTVPEVAEIFAHVIAELCGRTPPHLLGWSFGGLLAHEVAHRMAAEGRPVSGLSLLDSHLPGADRATSEDELADAKARRRYLERTGLRVDELDRATLDRILHATRAHMAMQAQFRPGLVRGRVDFFSAGKGEFARPDVAQRWSPYVDGELVEHVVPATHHGMLRHAALTRVMRVLRRVLDTDPAVAR